MKEIRVYVEGGGDKKDTKTRLREGFAHFLAGPMGDARSRRTKWHLVMCGSRQDAHKQFSDALAAHADALNLLLVDAEAPVVAASVCEHLEQRDQWKLRDTLEDQCHLMVQTMETWLIADKAALKGYYGTGFRESALPRHRDLEQVAKADLNAALEKATSDTSKGTYHKTRHAPDLLCLINPAEVRKLKHCDRLFRLLEAQIAAVA